MAAETKGAKIARAGLGVVLGSWFLATALSQDPTRTFHGARKWDPSGAFVPDWRFFAPRPGMHDYHLLFRDELPSGDYTDWTEVAAVEQRRWQHFFWYASRRGEKVLADSVAGLIGYTNDKKLRPEDVQLSISYLTLLNFVTSQIDHHPEAKRVQFLIAAGAGYDESEEPMMLFMSNPHPLR